MSVTHPYPSFTLVLSAGQRFPTTQSSMVSYTTHISLETHPNILLVKDDDDNTRAKGFCGFRASFLLVPSCVGNARFTAYLNSHCWVSSAVAN